MILYHSLSAPRTECRVHLGIAGASAANRTNPSSHVACSLLSHGHVGHEDHIRFGSTIKKKTCFTNTE